jgi:omega-amidase
MRLRLAQLFVGPELGENCHKILSVLQQAVADEWVVFPEGMLSGYQPEDIDYLRDISSGAIDRAINEIATLVRAKRCHCIFGSATRRSEQWFNSVIIIDPEGNHSVYDKIELAGFDLRHFTPGHKLFFQTRNRLNFATLACRELLFPQTWLNLKKKGVQMLFHINNAIRAEGAIWKHILISRAIENSIFVCSVNNANPPQSLASYLISPSVKILLRSKLQREEILTTDVDLDEPIANPESSNTR